MYNMVDKTLEKDLLINPNRLILLVGKSGIGKSKLESLAVERLGFKAIKSYTTRPKRYKDEDSHIFVTNEEFDKLEDIVAYTEFDGYRYCATKQQLDDADIYVIDPKGVNYLKEHYNNKELVVVYIEGSLSTRAERMEIRGDTECKIINRLSNDYVEFEDFECDEKYDIWLNGENDIDVVFDWFMWHLGSYAFRDNVKQKSKETREDIEKWERELEKIRQILYKLP